MAVCLAGKALGVLVVTGAGQAPVASAQTGSAVTVTAEPRWGLSNPGAWRSAYRSHRVPK